MSAFVLVAGTMLKPPEPRVAKSGKPYVTTVLWADDEYWNLVVFSETARAELMRLRPGDNLAVQGQLQISVYTGKDGREKIGRTILVGDVLALRRAPMQAELEL